eukprot:m.158461 g.158461  ORF g.158461 m.158461 type:complete len:875 (+) comp17021_c0_seq5:760-3384(+)
MAGVRARWRAIPDMHAEYKQIRVLGKGNYGKCVLARHLESNELCCMKILKEHDYFTRREVDLLQLLTISHFHPGIVTYRDHFVEKPESDSDENVRYCIVMDYVEGCTLQELACRVRNNTATLDPSMLLNIIRSGLEALAFLHDTVHIAHRDVKPSNIVVTQKGGVVLIDFGLSVLMNTNRKAPQEECGTPNYFSPALIRVSRDEIEATKELWYASDIWGFGASLYYLCTGQEIAKLDESDPDNSFDQIMAFRCPRVVYADNMQINHILTSMLCIDYTKQPSAAALLKDLARIHLPPATPPSSASTSPSCSTKVTRLTKMTKRMMRPPLQRLNRASNNNNNNSARHEAGAGAGQGHRQPIKRKIVPDYDDEEDESHGRTSDEDDVDEEDDEDEDEDGSSGSERSDEDDEATCATDTEDTTSVGEVDEDDDEEDEEEDGGDVDGDEQENGMAVSGMETDRPSNKRDRTSEQQANDKGAWSYLHFPLPTERGRPVLVKIYDESQSVKVNSMVEVVGVLSLEAPSVDNEDDAADTFGFREEMVAHHPPASLVARLHAVALQPLTHSHPLLPTVAVPSAESAVMSEGRMKSARELTLKIFTDLLCGDELAAFYLLFHLMSNVHTRLDNNACVLGKMSLNLSGAVGPFAGLAARLNDCLQQLLAKCHLLPMTLENMNGLRLSPRQDTLRNKLLAGVLQLSDGTELILDESALQPGQLDAQGIRNVGALQLLLRSQTVAYDFEFSRIDFAVDVPVLVISEGRSMLPTDWHVPLVASEAPSASVLDDNLITMVRKYLGAARLQPYTIPEDVQQTIQNDFVSMRQQDAANVKGETLHVLLELARHLTVSNGESSLSVERWKMARFLQDELAKRLTQQPQPKGQ